MQTIIEHSAILVPILFVGIFLLLTYLAIRATRKVLQKEEIPTNNGILANAIVPGVSLIVPVHNTGGHNMVPTISSLFELQYPNIEIIIVNDGSTDDSLEWMIKAFELQKVHFSFPQNLATHTINGVYKSSNEFFKNLTLIDKQYGGVADALNAGINAAHFPLFVNIDTQSYLSKDALQKMVKVWLDIGPVPAAAICSLRPIYNSSVLSDTDNDEVTFLERSQIIEYMRSLLMTRMPFFKKTGAFSQPGLFILFDREISIKVGGYHPTSLGQNNDLLARLYQYAAKHKTYKIKHLQTPVCWFKAPNRLASFIQQRQQDVQAELGGINRHKGMFLNPKYGLLGFLNYPFWLFHKLLLPLFLIIGAIYLFVQLLLVNISFIGACYLLCTVYLIFCLFSSTAILFEDQILGNYKSNQGTVKLLLTALFEPFYYLPIKLWAKTKGIFMYFGQQNTPPPPPDLPNNTYTDETHLVSTLSDDNTRTDQDTLVSPQSLKTSIPPSSTTEANWLEKRTKGLALYVQKNEMAKKGLVSTSPINKPDYSYLYNRLWEGIEKFSLLNICFFVLLLFTRIYEYLFISATEIQVDKYELIGACYDALFMGKLAALCFLPFILLYLLLPPVATGVYRMITIFLAVGYFILADYFAKNLVPLGIEWANYDLQELIDGLGQASAIGIEKLIIYGFVIITFPFLHYLIEKVKFPSITVYPFYIILVLSIFFYLSPFSDTENTEKNLPYYTSSNKLELFIDQNYD